MASDPKKEEVEQARNEIEEILRRVDSLPTVDCRPPEDILGYDEQGLPR